MRPRHSDADLLGLARDGSAPAFASFLHRHRDVLQRAALRSAHPERIVEATMVAAVRDLHRGRVPQDGTREWLVGLVEARVGTDPGSPGVERLLPGDWFDRAWTRAWRTWPTGRRRVRPPRWAVQLAAATVVAATGAVTTYVVITSDATTEVVSELVAEPIEDPDVLVVPGPVVEAEPEEAPELFGDVELGELPTYDLTGESGRAPAQPSLGPPGSGDGGSEEDRADDRADDRVPRDEG